MVRYEYDACGNGNAIQTSIRETLKNGISSIYFAIAASTLWGNSKIGKLIWNMFI